MNAKLICCLAAGAALIVGLTGCTTTEQALGAGAATGAIVGHMIAPGPRGAAVGAIIGGAMGAHVGSQEERYQRTESRLNAVEQQSSTTVVWIANPNGSRTPVTLRRAEGGQWIGPRGEYYDALPSEAQLRPIYGL